MLQLFFKKQQYIKVEFMNMYFWDSLNWQLHNAIPIIKHVSLRFPSTGMVAPYNGPKVRLNHTVVCHCTSVYYLYFSKHT